jgi:hypothetical protein
MRVGVKGHAKIGIWGLIFKGLMFFFDTMRLRHYF